MTTDNSLPLSIRDVGPSPDAIRLTGITGWYSYRRRVAAGRDSFQAARWPSLCQLENHYPTREAECLEQMADKPLFPRNWHIEFQSTPPVWGATWGWSPIHDA